MDPDCLAATDLERQIRCFLLKELDCFMTAIQYDTIRYCVFKGPFVATQLNSTRRRVELSCVAINGPLRTVKSWQCTSIKTVHKRVDWQHLLLRQDFTVVFAVNFQCWLDEDRWNSAPGATYTGRTIPPVPAHSLARHIHCRPKTCDHVEWSTV